MPRTGWRKSASDRRLPDLVSVGLLTKVFPAEVVDAVITQCGRTEQRRRSLLSRASRNCPVAVMKTARWWPWDLPSGGHQRRSVRCGAVSYTHLRAHGLGMISYA